MPNYWEILGKELERSEAVAPKASRTGWGRPQTPHSRRSARKWFRPTSWIFCWVVRRS